MLGGGVFLAADAAVLTNWQGSSRAAAGDTAASAANPPSVLPDSPDHVPSYELAATGYTPDGTAGSTAAYPLSAVRLLDSPFRDAQLRNLDYLLFLDPDRLLHTFMLNYGLPSSALPCGGWENPRSLVRGHNTGHLLSGLALSYANTGSVAAKAAGEYVVGQLAQLQAMAPLAGYSPGYLSAFPEVFFEWLETGQWSKIWSPYYMIHKYLAGLIDSYQLAGTDQALDVATSLADWVDKRTSRLSYAHMQQILEVEFGGLPEALVNLYSITGSERYLATAQRFYHARFLDPLAKGVDNLAGWQCNVSTPKILACLRQWEETGEPKYRDITENFWRIATEHHAYVNGGQGNYEHWGPPDVLAGALSNYTCEGCVTYNMLKVTRLLHFHQLGRVDLADFYERALFNQMLGLRDPRSAHGFVVYYSGLSAGAFKQQPLNYFPHGNPDVYSTDWDNFACDNATGLETQAKFADTIYARDARGIYVNLFIPSEVHCADQGVTLRQTTGFPDDPVVRLTVERGSATMAVRVRVPSWTAGAPVVVLNGTVLRDVVFPGGSAAVTTGTGRGGASAGPAGGWVVISRRWLPGDLLEVTLPMQLAFNPAPDRPTVQAVSYGPVVLSGLYGSGYAAEDADPGPDTGPLPFLDAASVRRVSASPLTFAASADDGVPVSMIPVARAQHENFTVYWETAKPAEPPVTITGQQIPSGAARGPARGSSPAPATATKAGDGPRRSGQRAR